MKHALHSTEIQHNAGGKCRWHTPQYSHNSNEQMNLPPGSVNNNKKVFINIACSRYTWDIINTNRTRAEYIHLTYLHFCRWAHYIIT